MQLHYTLTQEDFLQGSKLHEKHGSRILIWTVVGALLLLYFLVTTDLSNTPQLSNNLFSMFIALAVFILVQTSVYHFLQRKEFLKNPALSKEVRYHFSDAGLHCDDAFTPWDEISKWKQDARNTLIYTDINHFYIIPSRILDEAQEKELSKYLNEKVSQVA